VRCRRAHELAGTPFLAAARSTLRKLVTVMPSQDVERAREIAARIRLRIEETPADTVPRAQVLEIGNLDRRNRTGSADITRAARPAVVSA
jgi:hypothetical protein